MGNDGIDLAAGNVLLRGVPCNYVGLDKVADQQVYQVSGVGKTTLFYTLMKHQSLYPLFSSKNTCVVRAYMIHCTCKREQKSHRTLRKSADQSAFSG